MEEPEPASADALSALRRIVEQEPVESWQDPGVLRGRLADRLVSASEVNLLVNALREGVPQRIRRERADTPHEVLLGVLRTRLIEGQGMSLERAAWAARTWLDALMPDEPAAVDEFVWGPHVSAATKESAAKKAGPAPPPSSTRFTVVTATIVIGSMLAIARWLDTRGTPDYEYTVVAVAVFASDVGSVEPGKLLKFASSCMAGAAFGSQRCRVLVPVSPTTPFVGVDQTVTYTTDPFETVSVPVTCTLTDPGGRSAGRQDLPGALPDRFGQPSPAATTWRVMFKRPEPRWTPGLYRVTCASPRISIEGWFEVQR